MTTQALPASIDAKNRECGCPPWVRCVPFGGRVILLMDLEMSDHRCLDELAGNRYGVLDFQEVKWRPCVYGGCDGIGFFGPPPETTRNFPDLASAQAEFDLRARELLEARDA